MNSHYYSESCKPAPRLRDPSSIRIHADGFHSTIGADAIPDRSSMEETRNERTCRFTGIRRRSAEGGGAGAQLLSDHFTGGAAAERTAHLPGRGGIAAGRRRR